jgi:hypothetical protein
MLCGLLGCRSCTVRRGSVAVELRRQWSKLRHRRWVSRVFAPVELWGLCLNSQRQRGGAHL